ncbi:benzoylformate decarboxylase [Actinomadura coerulea]|uniref:Benzoylformate decarboxylase n=1 Tax=Actinomadura coerulea TaxID=46159 RepID=A0A7X0KZ73_9ACTN|nr:benzoylformate decarboxylase [Actinomadura coerulea]MBB6396166.1 benzoylformate decarboxylase [Actinomadura coerulea]GGQ38577.1 benzoylformate decarboxylase [Actinomadura coerulea]
MTTRLTVREAFFDFCRSVGMTTVFGNPGSTELRMFRDFPDDFRYVLALQETVAVAAAAGHSLGTGGATLVSLHSAGGVGHSLGAVFNAYRDRVPVVIIAGQQSRAMLPTRPFLGADEPAQFPRPYVKWSRQPERAEDVPAALAEAYRVAMTHPRGPVFLSVPEDDWDRPAEPVPAREIRTDFTASPAALREVAAALDGAANPVIVVGAGVEDEGALPGVVELAERTGAPVWISPLSGRSGFPEDHPLFRGFLPPVRQHLSARLEGHDVILVLGAPVFTYHVHSEGRVIPEGARLFHFDCDPATTAWAPVGTSVLTTIDAGVSGLLELVAKADRPHPEPRERLAKPQATDPIDPALVVETLRERMPEDAVIVEECPSHRDLFHARLPITRSGGFLTTGSGALGWGLPVAVGRAVAGSGERIVCVIGDGSTMYSVQSLWTAAQHRVPMTVLVLNNHGYGAVKALGRRIELETVPGTDIHGIDFVALARSLGCDGRTVTRAADLDAAMAEGLAHEGPFVIDVRVAADDSALYAPEAR